MDAVQAGARASDPGGDCPLGLRKVRAHHVADGERRPAVTRDAVGHGPGDPQLHVSRVEHRHNEPLSLPQQRVERMAVGGRGPLKHVGPDSVVVIMDPGGSVDRGPAAPLELPSRATWARSVARNP